jgi:subtilisin family serine protease
MISDPDKKLPVIVEMRLPSGPLSEDYNQYLATEAYKLFGKLKKNGYAAGELPLVNGAAGFANAKGIESLSRESSVSFIHEDSLIYPLVTTDPEGTRPPGQLSAPYPRVIRADKVWLDGPTGKGVTVAVLDSGIAPHADLTLPTNRLLASVNFAGDLGGMADAGGHGTHVAGIIAGNGTRSDLSRNKTQPVLTGDAQLVEYVGVAPGASLVDVRVLNQAGYGRKSSVIKGIQWVIAHRDQYNIRVINLSFGAPARLSYRQDPLSAAVEIAWKRGLVVVASAGNAGPAEGTVRTPGIDPYVITVGALDDQTTLPIPDDQMAWFSSRGTPPDSTRKPELLAPGRRIVSLRVPDSHLDRLLDDRVVTAKTGADYFRMTGSSMATGVVSGVVALMLERNPSLKPDQVKAILIATAQLYGQGTQGGPASPDAYIYPLVDAYAAVNARVQGVANQGLRPSDGFARVVYPILYGQPLTWKDPTLGGTNWDNLIWDNLIWDNLIWDNLIWDGFNWDNLIWDNLIWDNLIWDNLIWDNLIWDNLIWDSLRELD